MTTEREEFPRVSFPTTAELQGTSIFSPQLAITRAGNKTGRVELRWRESMKVKRADNFIDLWLRGLASGVAFQRLHAHPWEVEIGMKRVAGSLVGRHPSRNRLPAQRDRRHLMVEENAVTETLSFKPGDPLFHVQPTGFQSRWVTRRHVVAPGRRECWAVAIAPQLPPNHGKTRAGSQPRTPVARAPEPRSQQRD
ncbi:hypothetical protein Bbelb_384620 [Branchiostoma belcheri]|nr:hypothetical protein Bbelb_384620 [Branchiostoma belcheri]